jgi:hypothetical protein
MASPMANTMLVERTLRSFSYWCNFFILHNKQESISIVSTKKTFLQCYRNIPIMLFSYHMLFCHGTTFGIVARCILQVCLEMCSETETKTQAIENSRETAKSWQTISIVEP